MRYAFINWVDSQLTINNNRKPNAAATDIEGLLESIANGDTENLCVSIESVGEILSLLMDGEYLASLGADDEDQLQDFIEDLSDQLNDFFDL